MLSIYSFCSVLFLSLLQLVVAERKCYALNGNQLGDAYRPCNPDAKHSGCCAIHPSAGSADLCLSNGLCMATNEEYMGTIWQSGCTDPTGMDPSCPKLCPDARNEFANGSIVSAWNVQTCDYGAYCCRAVGDHKNCCTNATAPQIKTNFIGAFQSETSTAGESSTPSPTFTTSTQSSSTSTSPTTSKISILGAATSSASSLPTASNEPNMCAAEKHHLKVVGGTLAAFFCAAIAGLSAAMFFLFRKEKKQRKLKEHYEAQIATTSWGAYGASKSTIAMMASTRDSVDKDVEVRYIGRQNT